MFFASKSSRRAAAFSVAFGAGASLGVAAAPACAQEPPPVIAIVPQPVPAPRAQVYPLPVRPALGPRVITDWEDDEPIPLGYRPVNRVRKGLVIAGAITFGTVYLTTALGGAIAADSGGGGRAAGLLLPVVGPLAMLGGEAGVTGSFLLVLNTLAQAAGVTMFVVGVTKPKQVLVRSNVAKIEVTPVPMSFGPNSAGFGLTGRF